MISNVRLRNWKSHLESEFSFSPGVNAIIGIMGSGKTSILQAISFGLYGTLPALQTRRVSMDDLIMKRPQAMDEAEVEVSFSSGGEEYSVLRALKRGKGTVKAELRKAGKLLETNAQGVTREVARVLDMDYDMFSKAVYSEQNSIDYFMRIPRGQRMEHIDRMLRLDRFEKVRELTVTLSNRVRAEREEKLKMLRELQKEGLPERIARLRGELEELNSGIEETERNAHEAEQEASRLEERVALFERDDRELNNIERELGAVREALKQTEQSIRDRGQGSKDMDTGGLDSRLGSLEQAISELEEGISASRKGMDKGREEVASLNAEIRAVRENLENLGKLSGTCPLCESELNYEKKRELEESRKGKERELLERAAAAASGMEDSRRALEDFEARMKERMEERESLKALKREIGYLEELNKRRGEHLKRREELEKKKGEVSARLDGRDIRALRQALQEAVSERSVMKARLESARQRISDKQEMLKDLRKREDMMVRYNQESMQAHELLERMGAFTGALRLTQDQLREEFLKSVNQTMDMIWAELYPYGDYTGIRLAIEKDYVLQLRESSGWQNVEGMASGGERSVAALALRVAFSMAFIPNLRWLILDEPTHNLDSNAIEHLTETLRDRIGAFVEQVFLITHDERVSEGVGGSLYRLERDKDQNGPTRVSGTESE